MGVKLIIYVYINAISHLTGNILTEERSLKLLNKFNVPTTTNQYLDMIREIHPEKILVTSKKRSRSLFGRNKTHSSKESALEGGGRDAEKRVHVYIFGRRLVVE